MGWDWFRINPLWSKEYCRGLNMPGICFRSGENFRFHRMLKMSVYGRFLDGGYSYPELVGNSRVSDSGLCGEWAVLGASITCGFNNRFALRG